MKTRILLPRAASLLLLLAFIFPTGQAQTVSSDQTAQAEVVDEAAAAREQIAQFRQTLDGLSPIERRDAMRQFIETNFPDGLPMATADAATINQRMAEQDSKPVPALKLPANATPAQIAYLKARRQLLVAFRIARRAAFVNNAAPTPEQRRNFIRQWQEGPGAPLVAQVRQKQQALSQEDQQKLLQFRQSHSVVASVPASIAQTNPALAAALAQQNVLNAERLQIMARTDLTTPEQRRDALRQWHEANKARIDSAQAAVSQALAADQQSVAPSTPRASP